MDSADSSDFVWNCDVPRVQDLDLWSVHLVSNCTHSDVKDGQDSHNIFSTPKLFSFASLCTFSGTTMWRRIHLQYEAFSKKLNQWSWLVSADCFSAFSEMNCETIWTKFTTNAATCRLAWTSAPQSSWEVCHCSELWGKSSNRFRLCR